MGALEELGVGQISPQSLYEQLDALLAPTGRRAPISALWTLFEVKIKLQAGNRK